MIFAIGGNKYRLVAWINYGYSTLYVRFIGTHAESRRWGVRAGAAALLIGTVGGVFEVLTTASAAAPLRPFDAANATVSCKTLSVTMLGGPQPTQQQLLELMTQKCGSEQTNH